MSWMGVDWSRVNARLSALRRLIGGGNANRTGALGIEQMLSAARAPFGAALNRVRIFDKRLAWGDQIVEDRRPRR
jgi:hypothetical protein